MNITIKRALALTATMPLALAATVTAANAFTGVPDPNPIPDDGHGYGVSYCGLPPQHEEEGGGATYFMVELDRLYNGAPGYARSVAEVTVTAADNQGHNDWFDDSMKVASIAIQYKTDGDAVYSKTSYTARTGGVATFTHDRADVEQIKVTVNWYKYGNDGSMTIKCTFDTD